MTEGDSYQDRLIERMQELEKVTNQLQYGDEKLSIEISLKYLLELIIEQRQKGTSQRIRQRLHEILVAYSKNSKNHTKAQNAHRRLQQLDEWFSGAFRETINPIEVYATWLNRLTDAFKPLEVDTLILESDELPPPPPLLQEPD